MTALAFLTLAAYLIGSLPPGYLIGRMLRGVDLTAAGSRNIGAVNAWNVLGWRAGLAVLALDAAKGAVVVALARLLALPEAGAFAVLTAVTLGHNFSLFLRFKGGKGVAVVFGISAVVVPWLTLASLAVVPATFAVTRGIVWAFLAGFVLLNSLLLVAGRPGSEVGLCIALSAIVAATHLWRGRADILAALRRLDLASIGRLD